ncbi:SIS domain-containing protein [Leuconostocaceae bacterium ESL0723]|nr:SIS domain-containing protein [Leuconostocaceae bacterium ESL0723]
MTWQDILKELAENSDQAVTEADLERIKAAPRIFVAGAGRSGLAAKAFAMRLMQLGKTAFVAGETTTPALADGDILILVSSSGETSSLVRMAETAGRVGASVWLWSTSQDNTLARSATQVTLLAGKGKFAGQTTGTRQPLGTLFEQSAWLLGDLLTVAYMHRYQIDEADLKARHANLE